MGGRSVLARDCLVHVERNDSFEIKHDDGAMQCVIIRWLLMTLCSEYVNIVDRKLYSPLNQSVEFKDSVEHMFHKMLYIFSIAIKCLLF